METKTYDIEGLNCQHCVGKVRQLLDEFDGISHVEINKEAGKLVLHAENIPDVDALNKTLGEAGHYHLTPQ